MIELTSGTVKELWEAFGDIPIDDMDRIMEPFMGWETGTNRFEIWGWFDRACAGGLRTLMFGEDDENA